MPEAQPRAQREGFYARWSQRSRLLTDLELFSTCVAVDFSGARKALSSKLDWLSRQVFAEWNCLGPCERNGFEDYVWQKRARWLSWNCSEKTQVFGFCITGWTTYNSWLAFWSFKGFYWPKSETKTMYKKSESDISVCYTINRADRKGDGVVGTLYIVYQRHSVPVYSVPTTTSPFLSALLMV